MYTNWQLVAESVQGSAHQRSGLVNQDYWDAQNEPIIACFVSDGHGSKRYFRSHIGSRIAVESSLKLVSAFFAPILEHKHKTIIDRTLTLLLPRSREKNTDEDMLSLIKRTTEEKLPQLIVNGWEEGVAENVREDIFTEKELEVLDEKDKQMILGKPVIAYGATLLGVLIGKSFIVYLQLGDGDILTVDRDGEVSRPLVKDNRFIGNETISLCSKNAWNELQIRFQVKGENTPELIMISTDGYSNSFASEDDFNKAAQDFFELMRDMGKDYVQANLKEWLEETSSRGSGDDTTVVLISQVNSSKNDVRSGEDYE